MDTLSELFNLFTEFGLEKAMTKTKDAQSVADTFNSFINKYYLAGTEFENEQCYSSEDIMKIADMYLSALKAKKKLGNAVKTTKNKAQEAMSTITAKVMEFKMKF